MFRETTILAGCLLWSATLGAVPVLGQASTPAPPDSSASVPAPWAPPTAGKDGFTWVRLISGEWVKGEIKDLRDGTLHFDSDELDEFQYDWDDVTAVISSRVHTVTTWERKIYTGFIEARRETIRIRDAQGQEVATVKTGDVSSMIQGSPREANYWGGLLSLGSTVRSGNSDQKDLTLLAQLNRRALVSRWDNTGTFNYSESGKNKNQESQRLTSRFDWFLSKDLFVTLIDYEYFRDPFQNIAYRHTSGVAMGFDWNRGPGSWDLSAGAAWRSTRNVSVQAGEDQSTKDWVGRSSANLEWDITSDVEFDLNYSISFPFDDPSAYTANMLSVLSLDLWWNLEIDLTFAWDRQNEPRVAEDGTRPRKDDYRLTTAVGWDF